jgi:hypothetical protein
VSYLLCYGVIYLMFRVTPLFTTVPLPAAYTLSQHEAHPSSDLETVSLPAAASIGERAFYDCTGLETASLPAAASIGINAFFGCWSLKTVSLPAAASIGNYAFSGCTGLETVSLGAAAPSVGTNMFNYVYYYPKTVTILVPNPGSPVYGSIPAAYSGSDTANNWGNAFRGKGWDGSSYLTGTVNSNVTLNIKYITP